MENVLPLKELSLLWLSSFLIARERNKNMKADLTKNKRYNLISRKEISEDDNKSYIGYGIVCKDGDGKIVFDISPCKEFVQRLVDLFNLGDVAPEHFLDCLEDALA